MKRRKQPSSFYPPGMTTPVRSKGQLWEQAHAETHTLPSWQRGEACRARYEELCRSAGYIEVPGARG